MAAHRVKGPDDETHAEEELHRHTNPPPEIQLRIMALESLLIERGAIQPGAVDTIVDFYETQVGPRNGARVIARAWKDAAFRERLITDAESAIAELGIPGGSGEHLVVVPNEPGVHNMVVCTLCSCYPWQILGLPPVWYKSAAYRSRAVSHPREVLQEFGVELPAETEVRVWDSNADIRYLVLPEQPSGTEHLSEEALAELVSRDSMIGTARPAARREQTHE